MPAHPPVFIQYFLKFFFLLAPFFVLTVFLSLTPDDKRLRRRLAMRVMRAVFIACFGILLFGNQIFSLFDITIDGFRVGAGLLLFLSAVDLVRGKPLGSRDVGEQDVTVVPLAVPITVGPATTGAIMIMGAESKSLLNLVQGCLGMTLAVGTVGAILFLSSEIQQFLKPSGILVLSKITGVVLAALAAQLVMAGVGQAFPALLTQ